MARSVVSHNPYLTNLDSDSDFHNPLMNTEIPGVIPVKFGDEQFTILIRDQIHRLFDLPRIKGLKSTDEAGVRMATTEIIEAIKKVVVQHTKDDYKIVIQVMSYRKYGEHRLVIRNQCLWNHRTDDVLSIETETNGFKFLIIIYGLCN